MRKIFTLVTIAITSFVMALAGLAASSVATASESQTVSISAKFSLGSSTLTKRQKAKIKKAVTASGKDATFQVAATAGRLPGVGDSRVKLLAKKRGNAVKGYLVKLGVEKSSVTTKVKITRFGVVPKTKLVGIFASPELSTITPTPTQTPTPTPTSTPTSTPTPTVVQACAAGGSCLVGDIGPGGGIVYFVDISAGGFACGPTLAATCNYLEVSPNGWDNGGGAALDPIKPWAPGDYTSGNAALDVGGIIDDTSTPRNNEDAIGLGLKNSIAIVTQGNDANTAAGAARAYTGGSKSDWYLPTTAELNLLCQWGRRVAQAVATPCTGGSLNTGTGVSGGFVEELYWSSSEANYRQAHRQFFGNGFQSSLWKFNAHRVRPVRAF
ncbi:MAG: hypothetical protein ACO3GT_05130 [Candidatus Nanopelagicales bacterium]